MWYALINDKEDVKDIKRFKKELATHNSCHVIQAPNIQTARGIFTKVKTGCISSVSVTRILKYSDDFHEWRIGDPLQFTGRPKKELIKINYKKYVEFETIKPEVKVRNFTRFKRIT